VLQDAARKAAAIIVDRVILGFEEFEIIFTERICPHLSGTPEELL
jgi:hypothetical protein